MSSEQFLSPVGFDFRIKKAPQFNSFIQTVTMPGISMGNPNMPTPFKELPIYGDHIEYGVIQASFKVNEDMSNYLEIYNWLTGIGFPKDHTQHKTLADQTIISGEGLTSDATLSILTSSMTSNIRIDIEDLFPVSMGDLTFDAKETDINYVECTAEFKFKYYTFTVL